LQRKGDSISKALAHSEFALWSHASIGPVPITDWQIEGREPFSLAELESIALDVKNAAYKVIEGKGATNYAIGLSGARIVEAILRDENAILPVSSVLTEYKGISDVALSVPSVVGAGGVERVVDVPMTDLELRKLQASAAALKATISKLGLD
jgi:L-lactate dehydrogenase